MLRLGECFAESILTILRQLASQPGPTSDEQTEEKIDPVLKGQQLDIETKDWRDDVARDHISFIVTWI